MFWQQDDETEAEYRAPDDVVDLVFRLRGSSIDIDHACALAQALREHLSAESCDRVGVLGIRLADSGNGWNRPEGIDAALPLSRRARLIIRAHQDQLDEVRQLSGRRLRMGEQSVEVGESTVRKLSLLGTLHARAVRCERAQAETEFLRAVAGEIEAMGIRVTKMMCGKSGEIRQGDDRLFTRSVMIAGLKPEESVLLQQRGIGEDRFIGCGLFVPHKGIDAVHNIQQQD